MAGRRDFYMTDEAEEHLRLLTQRWNLSRSATVARALKLATENVE